jgi:hypothetical protein
MSKFAIRLLTLTMYATAMVAVPMVTPAKAAAESSKQTKKKKKLSGSPGIGDPRSSGQARPNLSNPYDEPDRKVSY